MPWSTTCQWKADWNSAPSLNVGLDLLYPERQLGQDLDVDLDVVAGALLLVAFPPLLAALVPLRSR